MDTKSAWKEYIDAYVDLGIFYQSDEKYEDLEKAQQSYYQAAQLGNPEGMNGLALIYYNMPDNKGDEQAFRWFSKSADLGDSFDYIIWLLCMKTASEPISTNKRLGIYI